jgi:hypothetical protein
MEMPKILPMPAVTAMARLPPTHTRRAAGATFAPPSRAPRAPRALKLSSESPAIAEMRKLAGAACDDRHCCEARETERGDPRSLQWSSQRVRVDSELVPQVRSESIARAELLCDTARELLVQTTLHVDQRQLVELCTRLLLEFVLFDFDVRSFGVTL